MVGFCIRGSWLGWSQRLGSWFWSMRAGVSIVLAVVVLMSMSGVASASVGGCPGPGVRIFDCRVYELVSPVYKEGFPVAVEGVSEDGSQVLARSLGSFSNPEDAAGFGTSYETVRGEQGWGTTALAMPFSEFSIYSVEGVSPDFQSSFWFGSTPAQSNFVGSQPEDLYFGPLDGPLARVGPLRPSQGAPSALAFVGASEDLRHGLFVMHSPRVGLEESSLWPGDTTAAELLPSLYEYEYTGREDAEPRLVGVSNVGVPGSVGAGHLISDCGTYLGSFPRGDDYNAVSAGGTTVIFTAAKKAECGGPGPLVNEVYARVGESPTVQAHTVAISEPSKADCKVCLTSEGLRRDALFQGASRDGARVFFMTEQELLPGVKGGNLYVYDFNAPSGEKVYCVSVPVAGEAGVRGVARVSEDGSHVYFVAAGALAGVNREGKTPIEGGSNLYVFSSECPGGGTVCGGPVKRTSLVATLSGSDGVDWAVRDRRPVQATPTGGFLVFQSAADLTPDQEGREEAGQVFEYDARTEMLVRVSRGQGGYNEDGNSREYQATIPVQNYELAWRPIQRVTNLAVSGDGSRVFFSSPAALTPHALNGVVIHEEEGTRVYALNVYEYHDGQVGLISDGHDTVLTHGNSAVELIGTDESGGDVFFVTADSLVPQDTDTQVDVYDARVDGGFASLPVVAPCLADSCQDASVGPPSLLAPATSSVSGEGVSSVSQRTTAPRKKSAGRRRKAKSKSKVKRVRRAKRARHGSRIAGSRM
jgi:hypothetical protein